MNTKDALNRANPNTLPDNLRAVRIGDVLRSVPFTLYGVAPTLGNPQVGNAVPAVVLPEDVKMMGPIMVYARAGSGTLGSLAQDSTVPPAAGKFTITGSGDIAFAAADAWTSLDVWVPPLVGDIVELDLPVVANVAVIPAQYHAMLLEECTATAGTVVGDEVVDQLGTTVGTGHAALDAAMANIAFFAADAVTKCHVKMLVAPAVKLNDVLESDDATF